ncbi:RraA-like protein [Syncephalis fuscata]|nr:RraA-like protein [Syncephalis fuscata]
MSQDYQQLLNFSTCDVADALQALGYDGFLPGLQFHTSTNNASAIIGPAHTVKHVSTKDKEAPVPVRHFVDSANAGSIIVMSTPAGSINAVWGGLMSTRAKYLGVQGVIIDGCCRDVEESRAMGFPVYARGTSCYGVCNYTRPSAVGEPIDICQGTHSPAIRIRPDDIIMADNNGVIRICPEWIADILPLCERLSKIDKLCMNDLQTGHSIQETFAKHRS